MSEISGGVVSLPTITPRASSANDGKPGTAAEIRGNLDSARILHGKRGAVLCIVAGGQTIMYRLPGEKLATLMETGFASIRERIADG